MSLDLRPDHEEIVRAILARLLPPGAVVRVFGSRANGAAKPFSDLDLALDTGEPLSLGRLGDLIEAFCESDLPFKVDIVDLSAAHPRWRETILGQGVELPLR